MGFHYNTPFGEPWYLGEGSSSAVAAKLLEAALGGRPYRINWDAENPLRYIPVETMRQQADQSDSPGEQSLNPESLWRRTGESWHLGAGQSRFDRKDSSEFQFNTSQGVDIWDKWQLTLLKDTVEKKSSANTNLRFAVAGSHLYWTDGTSIQYITDLTTAIQDITGEPGTAPSSIVSDGFNVWTAHGASGIYKTTRGAATTASHITGSVGVLGYVRNRVLATSLDGRSLYDVTALAVGGAPGALPAALFTHGNTDFDFIGFAECMGYIYAAGFSGDKSLIYKTAVKEDGTALDQPSVAAELPDGEIVTCIYGYLGRFVFIGTSLGWRFAVVGGNGDLQLGARVNTDNSVLCAEGQGEFIWYGLTNYSETHSGLGRLSTAKFSDINNLVPAYASDLMVEGQGAIQSVVTFQGKRVFSVAGDGIYYEGTNCVESGHIDTGEVSYGMTEPKVGLWFNLQHEVEHGSFEVLVSVDGEAFISIGTRLATDQPSGSLGLGEVVASSYEFRLVLNRDVVDPTGCPVLLSWLFRVQPRPEVTTLIVATVFLAPEVESLVDTTQFYDTSVERDFIQRIHREKTITTFQVYEESHSVILEQYDIRSQGVVEGINGRKGQNYDCELTMKVAN